MNEQELKVLLEEGEGFNLEFKEKISGLDKEITAFSNSSGGRILVGITDRGNIKELEKAKMNSLKSEIQSIARNIEPSVKIEIENFKNILIINVPISVNRPHQCSSGFYLRQGANSQKMTRNEILSTFEEGGNIRFDEQKAIEFNISKNLDNSKVKMFWKQLGISSNATVKNILFNLGVMRGKPEVINNAGVLLFSKDLSRIFYHTVISCALYKGTDKLYVIDKKDFNQDLLASVESSMQFLKQHLNIRQVMTGNPKREDIPEIPYEVLREGIINAVIHRNYFEKGANILIEVFDDRIDISNPGGLIKGLSKKDFGQRSLCRNPVLAGLFQRIGFIEKMGTGIRKMKALSKAAGLKLPRFEYNGFFTVTFLRPKVGENVGINVGTNVGIKQGLLIVTGKKGKQLDRIARIVTDISEDNFINISNIATEFNSTPRTIERDFHLLEKENIVVFKGSKKTGKYEITEKGKKELRLG